MRRRRAVVRAHFFKDKKASRAITCTFVQVSPSPSQRAGFSPPSRTLVNIMVNVPREEICEQSPAGFG